MINEILEHNGHQGTVKFSESDKYFFGSLIESNQFTYEARNREGLESAFRATVNEFEKRYVQPDDNR